jgi:sulfonate transport system substrate-binding protein
MKIPQMQECSSRRIASVAPFWAALTAAMVALAGCNNQPAQTGNETPIAASTASGSAAGGGSSQPQTVRLGSFFTAVDYGPYLVAKNKGWFEEALKPLNAKPTYTVFQSLPPLNESLGADKVDVVFEAEPPAIVGKAAGINVKIAGISCKLSQEILVPKNSSASISGLKGKKIAVLAGTSSHYGVIKILEKAGLSKSDVEIIDMAPPEAKAAFETGKVDAWAVWPPFVEQEELAGKGKALGGGTARINSIMAMRGGFLSEQPRLAQAVYGVVQRSKAWMLKNPAQAQQIVSQELKVPLPVVKRAWPRHDWSATLDAAVTRDIQSKADFLKGANFIKNAVSSADLVDTSLQSAKPSGS